MSIWRPDATFYPSPKMAMAAPAKKLAYMVMINEKNNGRHDAIGVVDVDSASSGSWAYELHAHAFPHVLTDSVLSKYGPINPLVSRHR